MKFFNSGELKGKFLVSKWNEIKIKSIQFYYARIEDSQT